MTEVSATHIALFVLAALIGGVAGWIRRGKRAGQEKAAINAGWQEQMEAQRIEHQRLLHQNKGLMTQINEFQASNRDAKNRAKELSEGIQTAYSKRDELQREIKDVRSNLETVLDQRDRLRTDMASFSDESGASEKKDEKIFQLSRELESWHERLPPLLERYRIRNDEAVALEADLAAAHVEIERLQAQLNDNQTRIESVRDPDALTNGLDASNDDTDGDAGDPSGNGNLHHDGDLLDGLEPQADAEPQSLRDDLKQIKGVGPAIERTLNDMGIFRFQQIADMTEFDIDRVAERLKGFHSRIYRENWIGQARELKDRNQLV